jgi:hypothetical protein
MSDQPFDPKRKRDEILNAGLRLRLVAQAYCAAAETGTPGEKAVLGEALEEAAIAFGLAYNGPCYPGPEPDPENPG